MNLNSLKEVNYYKYCPSCKFYKLRESEDPCNECLTINTNIYSQKPMHYEKSNSIKKEEIK